MKKIYFSVLALSMVLFCGCSDFLEADNRSDKPTDEFYNTATGFESLTNAMYSTLRDIYNAEPDVFVGGTDIYGDGKSESVAFTYYTLSSTDGRVQKFYTNCYKGIQMANAVIAYGKTTEASKVREQYVAEARLVRAWYFFQLVQQFGGVALTTDLNTNGQLSIPRNSLKECYDFIISELEALVNDPALKDKDQVGHANKRAARFFLAKAYLTRGWLNGKDVEAIEENIAQSDDFQKALNAIKPLLSDPAASIETVFDIANEGHDEFFWTVQFDVKAVENVKTGGNYQMGQFGSYLGGAEKPRTKGISGDYSPLFNMHKKWTKGDGRYEQTFMLEMHGNNADTKVGYFDYYLNRSTTKVRVYFAPWWADDADIAAWKADDPLGIKDDPELLVSKIAWEGGIAPSNGAPETWKNRRHMDMGVPCIRKFDDPTTIANRDSHCSMHDASVARLGEALLIAAEAELMLGNKGNAANYINQLRKRPGTVKPGFEAAMKVTADDMNIDFILDERVRELAGEYVRWTDLKRTHKIIENVLKYQEDDIVPSNLKGPDGKDRILRPIPQSAIDLNQAEIEQNPGW